jgi:chromosome partitioning protein
MQTWAIIAQKGGQSKTTIATAFAVEAAGEGAAVVILDADDRQGSALYWSERRDTDDVMVKDSSVAGLPLHVSRGRDSGKVDLIIIDTPANSKDIAMLAAEQADFVVIRSRRAAGRSFRPANRQAGAAGGNAVRRDPDASAAPGRGGAEARAGFAAKGVTCSIPCFTSARTSTRRRRSARPRSSWTRRARRRPSCAPPSKRLSD